MRAFSKPFLLLLCALLLSLAACKEEEMHQMQEKMKAEKVTVEALVENTKTLWQALEKTHEEKDRAQLLALSGWGCALLAFLFGVGLGTRARDASNRARKELTYETTAR